MATFEYKAKDESGSVFSGVYTDVENTNELRSGLEKMGFDLVKAKKVKSASGNKKLKIKTTEIVSFAYEFAGMYQAGLSVMRCLQTFEEQTENEDFKSVIADIRHNIETGATLRQAFGKYNYVFSDFFCGMLDSGESSGKLAESLEMAAVYLDKQNELKGKVKQALTYPVVVCVMCLLIVTALVIFVIPVFQKLYSQLHITLPMPTQVLITLSNITRNYWFIALPVCLAVGYGVPKLCKMPSLRGKIDMLKLKLPVVGQLNRMLLVSRYVRTFAMMSASGVPIIQSLELAREVAGNSSVDPITDALQERIQTGGSVSAAMSEYDLFPPVIVQLAGAGEEAGVLPEMLIKGVEFYDRKIEKTIKSVLVKIEPALSVLLGLIVGSIMLGVYLPMFDYMGQVK
ncbi:General secretion pathway protein F [Anaerohalosphaera lusitana]|uniref:General secretion pathway protein F n=1 Tax=Anaerohalosphaera lusitana TaxID=1936003 RepID=A0A1U9NPD1_9BACT|nr:type II secretion system F family protein [Anaerohalosphaera lusitana]AQT69773.1 General secretion pathway protein F [Anaerohalosphaera lusitana]